MTLYKWPSLRPLYSSFFRLVELNSISSQNFINHLLWYNYLNSKNFSSRIIINDIHDNKDKYLIELAQCNNCQKTFNVFYTFKNELTINNLIATLFHLYELTNDKHSDSSVNTSKTNYFGNYWKDVNIGDYSTVYKKGYRRKNLINYSKELSEVYSTIKSRINKFNTRQLLFLAHVTKLLDLPHSREILRHISDMIIDQIWFLELIDFIRTGDSLLLYNGGNMSKNDLEFCRLYLHVGIIKYKDMINPKSDEFNIFKIITRCSCIAPTLLKELYSSVQDMITEYSDADLIYILTKYSQFQHKPPTIIIQILIHLSKTNLCKLDIDSTCDLIWSASKLYNRTGISDVSFPVLEGLKSNVRLFLDEINPGRLAMLVWAYSTTVPDEELIKLFLERAIRLYDMMDPNGLSNTLYGLSITIPGLSHELFDLANNVIIEYINSFNTIDLATVSMAYCNVKGGTLELHNAIGDVILELGTFISADCLVKIVYTYGTLNCCSNVIHGLIYSILERLNQFTTYGLCMVLWSFSVFHIFDVGIWQAILPLIECEKVVSDSNCELLHPALLEFKHTNPDVLTNVVNRLLNLSRDLYLDWQFKRISSINAEFAESVYQNLIEHYNLSMGESLDLNDSNGINKKIVKRYNISNIILDLAFAHSDAIYGVILFDESNITRIGQLPLGQDVQRDRLANALASSLTVKFKTIRVLRSDFELNGIKTITDQM